MFTGLTSSARCRECDGSGECPRCFGSGKNVALDSDRDKCPACGGTGICASCAARECDEFLRLDI